MPRPAVGPARPEFTGTGHGRTDAERTIDAPSSTQPAAAGDGPGPLTVASLAAPAVPIRDPEPIAGPTAGPTAEPTAEPTAGPTAEPTVEQATEQAAEPSTGPTAGHAVEQTVEQTVEQATEQVVDDRARRAATRQAPVRGTGSRRRDTAAAETLRHTDRSEPADDRAPVVAREDGFPVWSAAADVPSAPARTQPEPVGADAEWPTAQMRPHRRALPEPLPDRPVARPPRGTRSPAGGLVALVVLGLLAGFFGWVSAEPFWLAVGHAERGTATVTRCAGAGLDARCVGTFQGTGFARDTVDLSALPTKAQRPGVRVPARMVSATGRTAYAGSPRALHPLWLLGMLLVVICGLAIGWTTGAGRLETRRARMAAYGASVAAPLVLLAGMLVVAW